MFLELTVDEFWREIQSKVSYGSFDGLSLTWQKQVTPWRQDVNWMYVRCSETFLNVSWTSHVWSLYTLFRGEQLYHWLPKKVIHVQRQQWKRRWICRIFFKAKGNAKRQSTWSSLMLLHSFLLKKRLRLKPLFRSYIRRFNFGKYIVNEIDLKQR